MEANHKRRNNHAANNHNRGRKSAFCGLLKYFNVKKMFNSPDSPDRGKNRAIDEKIKQTAGSLKSKFVLVPSMEVKAWKAYVIVMFAAGFAAALVWSAYNEWYIRSGASGGKAVMEAQDSCKKHQKGDQFQSSVTLDTDGGNVSAVYVIAAFDKNAVEVSSVDTSASDFKYEIKKEIDPQNGKVTVALGQKSPGVNSSAARIAVVNLKALEDFKGPSLALKFDSKEAKNDSAAVSSNGLGTNVLEKVKSSAAAEECAVIPPVLTANCGDGQCGSGESCSGCPADCGQCVSSPNCGDGKCKGDESCSNCEKDCGVCSAPSSSLEPAIVINGKTRFISSDEPYVTTSKRIDFKGKLPEIAKGKVRVFQNGKTRKIIKVKPSGAWRGKIDIKKSGTYRFQIKYYDRSGKETGASENYEIVKKK